MPIPRDEWLQYAAPQVARDVSNRGNVYVAQSPVLRSSFPERQGRSVRLYGFSYATDGMNILISPYISSPEEMYLTALYATIRWACNDFRGNRAYAAPRRNTTMRLSWAGFQEPFNRIVPTAELMDHVQTRVSQLCRDYGSPNEATIDPAASRTPRQTTRMLKIVCEGYPEDAYAHEPYVARMSQRHIDRGLPFCPVCWGEGYTVRMTREG